MIPMIRDQFFGVSTFLQHFSEGLLLSIENIGNPHILYRARGRKVICLEFVFHTCKQTSTACRILNSCHRGGLPIDNGDRHLEPPIYLGILFQELLITPPNLLGLGLNYPLNLLCTVFYT